MEIINISFSEKVLSRFVQFSIVECARFYHEIYCH